MAFLNRSALLKPLVAILVFCSLTGGWSFYDRYRQGHAPLPDSAGPQGECALWFIGSSSMRRWSTVGQDMLPWIAHNRGMEGANYSAIRAHFVNERAKAPGAIILYAGENDLANGIPVRAVVRELAMFAAETRAREGHIPLLLLSMKPSPKRARIFQDQLLFNRAARYLAKEDANLHYVDVTTPLVEAARSTNLYLPDRVHMNPAGYAIWARIISRELALILPKELQRRCAQPQRG